MRHGSETPLACFTLFCGATHFTLETWYHLVWGQPLQALIVDYICNALMFFGGWTSLRARPHSGAGLIAASWAYALGFGWRSVFGRIELLNAGKAPVHGEAGFVLPVLVGSLILVAVTLAWAMALAWQQASKRD
jgi:hypothetical protein